MRLVWHPRGFAVRWSLPIVAGDGGPAFYAKPRDSTGRQVKRRPGLARMVRARSSWRARPTSGRRTRRWPRRSRPTSARSRPPRSGATRVAGCRSGDRGPNVNKHRQVLCCVFEHAMREDLRAADQSCTSHHTSAASPTRSRSTSTSPRRCSPWSARPAPGCTAIRAVPLCRRRSTPSAIAATSRTPRCSSSRRSPACGWASCSRCAGATSTPPTRGSSWRRAGPPAC